MDGYNSSSCTSSCFNIEAILGDADPGACICVHRSIPARPLLAVTNCIVRVVGLHITDVLLQVAGAHLKHSASKDMVKSCDWRAPQQSVERKAKLQHDARLQLLVSIAWQGFAHQARRSPDMGMRLAHCTEWVLCQGPLFRFGDPADVLYDVPALCHSAVSRERMKQRRRGEGPKRRVKGATCSAPQGFLALFQSLALACPLGFATEIAFNPPFRDDIFRVQCGNSNGGRSLCWTAGGSSLKKQASGWFSFFSQEQQINKNPVFAGVWKTKCTFYPSTRAAGMDSC